ncbi:hypothetical protein A3C37_00185 [Candidatus Peribacteria bacterium RIFCSPHIGHO2_02_FULL_53_20]|nr:MAG: hypothetical protein A3C37_00185 [Candidatus Peribacteria bacterium RIFCSPHIGHO2_02_FULL_53_20]OGJ66046.1 MAG: hypothetical protein A3B61_02230 [Candidatus Peribacteria bacterium RIFCSPLOWO2_01_FULL_53_10]OGJ69622.1 MAG: hypothetical protein A3G69_01470 [Candidatus Peribacteria bacterium RIFCSPLOWO2_12_FULL_53_10]
MFVPGIQCGETIQGSLIFNNESTDRRLAGNFALLSDAWHAAMEDVFTDADAEYVGGSFPRPSDALIDSLCEESPELVTYLTDSVEDDAAIYELKRIVDEVRPALTVVVVCEGDPMLSNTFYEQMSLRNIHAARPRETYLNHIHGLPYTHLADEQVARNYLAEVVQRFASLRQKSP